MRKDSPETLLITLTNALNQLIVHKPGFNKTFLMIFLNPEPISEPISEPLGTGFRWFGAEDAISVVCGAEAGWRFGGSLAATEERGGVGPGKALVEASTEWRRVAGGTVSQLRV